MKDEIGNMMKNALEGIKKKKKENDDFNALN
jgi:hypothetical protein